MKTPLVFILGMTLAAQSALALSSYVSQIPNGATFSCANCHINPAGGGTRNGFGNAFANNSHIWNATLAALDSDGDGYSNGDELGDPTGTWTPGQPNPAGPVYNPGDATSHPGATATAPTITTQPVSQTVAAGANVTFTVGASGTAPLSYQWRLNGANISGATSSSLTLTAVTSANAGSYTAVVSNSAGSATSAAATLTVTSTVTAPTITTQPVSQTVPAGATVTFTVGATGTAPLNYQWRLNGANIPGATSSSLALTAVTSANAGSYTAVVSNSAGSATSTAATLTVTSTVTAPTITTQPVSQTVSAGANVTITVGATGTAPLSYQWRLNGANIPGATSSSLTLTAVTSANAGSYAAVVSNSAGSATSTAATLTVNAVGAPAITTQPISQTVTVGANVTFMVSATGTAPLSYQWMLNSASIPGATTSAMTLNSVTTANAGSYTVRVSNSAGSVTSAAATLTVDPAVGAAAGTLILGWNNLGMHCMDKDFSVFSILPPYNTIEAQLIVNGALVTNGNGYTVTYEAVADPTGSINTTAQGKTGFYQYTPYLYGALPMDMGLKGWAMPGAGNVPQGMLFENNNSPASGVSTPVNWFRAEGIPITPYDDALQRNEYPMMRVVARDAAKNIIAANDIVLPVSDEMDCRACHASGTGTAKPVEGWVNDPNPERDYRLNILRLHDELQDPNTYPGILSSNGFSPQGLYHNVVTTDQPVLCAKCHLSEALQGSGYGNLPPLTTAIHSLHASVTDPATGTTLDSAVNRTACYRCHPGTSTKCLRGAMGSAVANDGTMEMQCQSCHGKLSKVGDPSRIGWFMEPNCQSCHTGTATSNNGQIRYASCFDTNGNMRVAVNQTFATTPNTPAVGLSLYRFSAGHGGLQCSACHGSTHAEFPTSEPNDNIRNTELQGHAGPMVECSACHTTAPSTSNGGPHGMHPVGQSWVSAHPSNASSACQACHGTDYRGTVLSEMQADRTLNGRGLFRGAIVSCYICHNGPGGSGTPPANPTVSNVSASTPAGQPAAMTLPISGTGAYPRIISQPAKGTVGLSTNGSSFVATYFPAAGFTGTDAFTFAAYNGYNNSSLATGTVTVGGGPAPVPPTITTQPVTQTVNAGANVTFTVGATGTAPLSYQWQKNGVNITGATSSSLTLTSVTSSSAASYRAIVSNSAGWATSASATLTVLSSSISVTLTSPANGATYTQGSYVRLTASVSSTAAIARVQFYDGSNLLGTVTSSPYTMTTRSLSSGTHSLTARATDVNGRSATSAPVQITVRSSHDAYTSTGAPLDH